MQKTFDNIFGSLKGRGGLFSQTEKLRQFGVDSAIGIDKKYLEDDNIAQIETIL